MENYGSEIGQKMRSAVKAKLLELGTGGTTGYIDDELPDYVMIMVANKRSKEQMSTDLDLFLGSQTELFVTWLHEVLQKLQEVTLPSASAKKRKSISHKDQLAIKKDKKTSKKEKRYKTPSDVAPEIQDRSVSAHEGSPPVISSISDVITKEALEKAKLSLDVTTELESHVKKPKNEKLEKNDLTEKKTGNDFDIPTISEISLTTFIGRGEVSETISERENDIAELIAIEKKINAAKKHLKQFKELGDIDEFDDSNDDFINLSYDKSPDGAPETIMEKNRKSKSPIIFNDDRCKKLTDESSIKNANHNSTESVVTCTNVTTPQIRSSRERTKRESPVIKRPVHERLGLPQQHIDPPKRKERKEKELYVPAHRRRELNCEYNNDKRKLTEYEKNKDTRKMSAKKLSQEREIKNPFGSERQTVSSKIKKMEIIHNHHKGQPTLNLSRFEKQKLHTRDVESDEETNLQRVESRIIVAPPKQAESSAEEENAALSVNSVIKIKPRPPVSPSKQACSNLLLRAMADAQRSTVLQKSKKSKSELSDNNQSKTTNKGRVAKLYTPKFRDHIARTDVSCSSSLFRRQAEKLVIELKHGINHRIPYDGLDSHMEKTNKVYDEYENDSFEGEPYVPQLIEQDCSGEDENYDSQKSPEDRFDHYSVENTQFVVTLNDDKSSMKYMISAGSRPNIKSESPIPQVSSSSNVLPSDVEPTSTSNYSSIDNKISSYSADARQSDIRSRLQTKMSSGKNHTAAVKRSRKRSLSRSISPGINTPPLSRRSGFTEIYQKPGVKKIIIKNDTDEEDFSPQKYVPKSNHGGRQSNQSSPTEDRSTTPPLSPTKFKRSTSEKKATSRTPLKRKRTPITFETLKTSPLIEERIHNGSRELCSPSTQKKGRSESLDRHEIDRKPDKFEHTSSESHRRISIRTSEARKYDNIPSLSSVALNSPPVKGIIKPKEKCKYHPNCTKQFCDYYHPSAPCKSFPNCKFADKCMYSHPKCKYDMNCTNGECNFSHSGPRNPINFQNVAPPISSHVVPVQNYKSISAVPISTSPTCKYYPNCTKLGCMFYHPKPCRFGKNCINKLECSFYHHETQSSNKFKWIASSV